MAKILVVDDDALSRELLMLHLNDAGHAVRMAADPVSALQLLAEPFDLVITDVQMPLLNGLELAAAIRQHPKTSALPLIVVTGSSPDDVRWRQARGLASAVLSKPFDPEELARVVASALASNKAPSEPRLRG